jgi:hypothetical protein
MLAKVKIGNIHAKDRSLPHLDMVSRSYRPLTTKTYTPMLPQAGPAAEGKFGSRRRPLPLPMEWVK